MNNIIWLTGLPSSGKTTIAIKLVDILKNLEIPCVLLDGDDVRKYISPDLGYSKRDRNKQMDKLYGISKLVSKNNIICIVCTNTAPTNRMNNILTIYVKCNLDVCKERDVKHLYEKYDKGEIKNLPGIDLEYPTPKYPFLTLETDNHSIDECVIMLENKLREGGII